MEAKLIKKDDIFYLYIDESWSIASTDTKDNRDKKLSLKNCQAIELGYDLDELAKEFVDYEDSLYHSTIKNTYMHGFLKALEILGDKKFSEEDMINFAEYCKGDLMKTKDLFNEYQSLQQTEFSVEIVMGDSIGISDKYTPDTKPKLDQEGCSILKRK